MCGSGTTGEDHVAVKVIIELKAKPGLRDELTGVLELLAVPFRVTVISQLS
jgi:hypothetical protein